MKKIIDILITPGIPGILENVEDNSRDFFLDRDWKFQSCICMKYKFPGNTLYTSLGMHLFPIASRHIVIALGKTASFQHTQNSDWNFLILFRQSYLLQESLRICLDILQNISIFIQQCIICFNSLLENTSTIIQIIYIPAWLPAPPPRLCIIMIL